MQSKTPKFDKALEKYFSELELDEQGGQERTCLFSGEKFYITAEDIQFYKKMGVPLPTLSPHERTRRRLASFNLYNLFYGKSAETGKSFISSYPQNTPYKIYEHKSWKDSSFIDSANEYDLTKSFFEQYKKIQLKAPRPNLLKFNIVNSEYVHAVSNAKNCYLLFDTDNVENSQYSAYLNDSKNCFHVYATISSNICYENNLCDNLYKCFFVEFSSHCIDSAFLFDCRDCSNCFMCTNLRHKKYCFENKQLSKEEYKRKIREINLGSRKNIEKFKKQFQDLKNKAIHRAHHNEKNFNCTGDYNKNSKNCKDCFYVINSENLKYVAGGDNSRDCMDVDVCLNSELVYDSFVWDFDLYNVKFSMKSYNLRDSEYCDLCQNCSNCFGCVSLKNKSFCIFNKQYTEEEYWQKVDEIKTKMLADGEYGEFFPAELAVVPYNISMATSYSGYDNIEEAKKYGYKIEDIPDNIQSTKNEISIDEVPNDIKDVTDDILSKTIIDRNGKKFKYTKEELVFHKKYNLALPTEHYSTILARKRISLGPIDFDLKYRKCTKCGEKTQVTFPKEHPDAPLKIYCERCYNQEVN